MDHCHQWSMLSPHLPVFPFICLSIYPTIYPFIQSSPSIYLPIYLSTFLSIHPLFLLTKNFSCSPFLLVKSLCCDFLTCISFSWHCCCPVTKLYLAFCNPMNCSTPGFPVFHYLLEFAQTHIHWVDDAIHPSNPLSLPSPPPSIFPSIRVFSKESDLHIRWPKYWSITPSNEYSGLISFRIHWFDLLAVQGTLKGLLQYHSSQAPIFWCSAFFVIQLSHPYMAVGKTIALTIWTFVDKVMSLLFNTLSRFVEVPVLWTPNANSSLFGKDPDAGKDWGQEEKRASENEMAGPHHWCSGHELGQALGDGEGQGGLVCCSPWGLEESDLTGQLNNNNKVAIDRF